MNSALLGLALCAALRSGAGALDVLPDSLRLDTAPGGKVKAFFTLRNDSPASTRVEIALRPMDGDTTPAPGWLRLEPRAATLAPGQARRVRVSGRVPRDVAEWVGRLVVNGAAAGGSWYELRLSRPVLVRVPASMRCAARLDSAARREGGDMRVEGVFENTGNVRLRPRFLLEWNEGAEAGEPARRDLDVRQAVGPGGKKTVEFQVPASGAAASGTLSAFFPAPDGDIRVERAPFRLDAQALP